MLLRMLGASAGASGFAIQEDSTAAGFPFDGYFTVWRTGFERPPALFRCSESVCLV